MPLLLSQGASDASGAGQGVARAAAGPVAADRVAGRHPVHRDAPATTAPRGAPVVIASAPVRQIEATTTTVPPPPTTVPAPPTTTTTTTAVPAPAPQAVSSVSGRGDVTYYAHPAGHCASPWLPFGTVVTVTNPANGATATCVVDDREADTARSIDLATSTFAEIAPLSQGVVYANLRW